MEKMQKIQSAPMKIPEIKERHELYVAAATINSGIAKKYWLELKQYPPGSARSLWLFVDNAWRHLDNPNYSQESLVQEVFCKCPERLEVKVWYSGSVIVGLVVASK